MTEEDLKEFDSHSELINELRAKTHEKFLEYSQLQLSLDTAMRRQIELFKKYMVKS